MLTGAGQKLSACLLQTSRSTSAAEQLGRTPWAQRAQGSLPW